MFFRSLIPIFCIMTWRAFALSPAEGYREIPWGASESNVLQKATGELTSNRLMHLPDFDNTGEKEMFDGLPLITGHSRKIIFTEKYNQRSEYIVCDNRLVAVMVRPATHLTMDPLAVIENTQNLFGQAQPVIRKDLRLPSLWGKLVQTETLQTFEWQSPEVLVRIPCRTWPIDDYRQAFYVIYVSKAQMARNIERIEEIRAEEEARRKAEEEARLKAQEAANSPRPNAL